MEERGKKIRDAFIANLELYRRKGIDDYGASQMAAISTREDFNISKNELIRILENE